MKTLSLRTVLVAAAFAAHSSGAGATEVRFSFHAAELGDPEALYERMEARAAAACATVGRRPLWARQAEKDCAAALLDEFVADAANPSLEALHDRSAGGRLAALR
ncbi:MAG: UrcA family protein [Parvularculaceae bacterium]